MSDGTFCRICHRLMVPNREQICVECKDAMKRTGYVKVVRCKDCVFYVCGGCGNIEPSSPARNLLNDIGPDWYCADGEGKEE